MRDFLSNSSRYVTTLTGASQRLQGCFLRHSSLKLTSDTIPGYCEFHQHYKCITLSESGAAPSLDYEMHLANYISSQVDRFSTLDLCGLHMPFRNGTNIFGIISAYDIDYHGKVKHIDLTESEFWCPVALSNITGDPELVISLDNQYSLWERMFAVLKHAAMTTGDF